MLFTSIQVLYFLILVYIMYYDLGPLTPLKNFKKPQRKSVIFSKVAGRQSSTFLKASLHQRFFNVLDWGYCS